MSEELHPSQNMRRFLSPADDNNLKKKEDKKY